MPALQRGRLRLQGGGGGDGQPGKEGRQEHGHQVHRGAPHQVDLLQPMLLHAILHQMPGHRNPASRYTHHLKYNNVGHDILQAATQLALAQVI